MMHKMRIRYILPILCMIFAFFAMGSLTVHADALDEIEKYEITAEVNEDATVNLNYHIEWRVLDSDSEGPLEWVKIGLSNSHVKNLQALSDTISDIELDEDGGTYARITFDQAYEEDEVVSFDFSLVQDYIYQMNLEEEGYTTYSFTPGWFDEIEVDKLIIRWKNDKMTNWSPDCLVKDGYSTWETTLTAGESFTIKVSYPNDAFSFNQEVSDRYEEMNYEDDEYYDDGFDDDFYDDGSDTLIIGVLVVWLAMAVVGILAFLNRKQYGNGANFAAGKPTTKITRTKIVYHTNCPNCGAPRADGKEFCEYCGTSLVKSEEIIKEEELTPEEKQEIHQYDRDGEYAYNTIPNTFIRVHTVVIPATPVSHGRSHGASRGGSHGGGHSCACACASCACACACACAGGGRAGCSNKDFYKNSLKLRQLKMKK